MKSVGRIGAPVDKCGSCRNKPRLIRRMPLSALPPLPGRSLNYNLWIAMSIIRREPGRKGSRVREPRDQVRCATGWPATMNSSISFACSRNLLSMRRAAGDERRASSRSLPHGYSEAETTRPGRTNMYCRNERRGRPPTSQARAGDQTACVGIHMVEFRSGRAMEITKRGQS